MSSARTCAKPQALFITSTILLARLLARAVQFRAFCETKKEQKEEKYGVPRCDLSDGINWIIIATLSAEPL